MPLRLRMNIGLLLTLLVSLIVAPAAPVSAAVPQGFTDSLVVDVPGPTALAFTPDGRMLVTTQGGELRVVKGTTLVSPAALTLGSQVCSNFERGLLGVAVDPQFASNGYIYLFYSYNKFGQCPEGQPNNANNPVNRVSRFTMSGDTVTPGSELVLVDNMTSRNGNHNAGDLNIGKDGLLYIAIGDGGVSSDTNRRDLLAGKILRVNRGDGSPAAGNPWFNEAGSRRCGNPQGVPPGSGPCQETFASGLRNPFRFAFDPDAAGTRFFINDVGQNTWEEIDEGASGANYGWPTREGPCANGNKCPPPFAPPPAGMTNPVYAYNRDLDSPSCRSITGGAFVPQGSGWPQEYLGSYLFGDYACGKITRLNGDGSVGANGFDLAPTGFATGLGGNSAVHMRFGPSASGPSLYYTTYAGGGEVRRIDYAAGDNRAPVAVIDASPRYTAATTLTVNFDGGGSSDPDGDALTYAWSFGDGGSGVGETVSHTYTAVGTYTATLVVTDANGAASSAASVRIDVGNTPPEVTIDEPPEGTYAVGQEITLRGSATDAEDPGAPTLRWDVILHHDDHTHPFRTDEAGAELTFTAPPPEDLLAATNSYLTVRLTATDSTGLSATATRTLNPKKVSVTIASEPSGMRIQVADRVMTTPATVTSWEGWGLSLTGLTQAGPDGEWYALASWSQGGEAAQTVVTPAAPATYTATFEPTNAVLLPVTRRP
jgi:glucose/arabinose dehydrogenase/PKD repeat protein